MNDHYPYEILEESEQPEPSDPPFVAPPVREKTGGGFFEKKGSAGSLVAAAARARCKSRT
jgi:hypothetical protein